MSSKKGKILCMPFEALTLHLQLLVRGGLVGHGAACGKLICTAHRVVALHSTSSMDHKGSAAGMILFFRWNSFPRCYDEDSRELSQIMLSERSGFLLAEWECNFQQTRAYCSN